MEGHTAIAYRVYHNWSGDILVDLRPASGDLYVVRKSTSTVGIPNASAVIEGPLVLLAKERPLQIVNLQSEKAGAINPRLLLNPEKVSFVPADGKAIQVSWR